MFEASRAASAHSSDRRRRRDCGMWRAPSASTSASCGGKGGRKPGDAAVAAPAAEQRQLEDARRLPAVGRVHAEGGEGMLEEREERAPVRSARRAPRQGAGRRRPAAGGRGARRRNRRPRDPSEPSSTDDAARERPVRRHQRDRRVGRSPAPRGWRARSRPPPPARCGRRGGDAGRAPRRGRAARSGRNGSPSRRRWSRPGGSPRRQAGPAQASGAGAAPRGSTSSRDRPSRARSCFRPNCGWPTEADPVSPMAAQAASSRSLVEAGQDDGALRQAGDRLEEVGGGGDRAGRSGGDDRPGRRVAASRSASARISVSRRTTGSTRPRSARSGRPCLEDDLQEIERDLEVAGVVVRREAADACPKGRRPSPCRPSDGRDRRRAGRRRRRRRG